MGKTQYKAEVESLAEAPRRVVSMLRINIEQIRRPDLFQSIAFLSLTIICRDYINTQVCTLRI